MSLRPIQYVDDASFVPPKEAFRVCEKYGHGFYVVSNRYACRSWFPHLRTDGSVFYGPSVDDPSTFWATTVEAAERFLAVWSGPQPAEDW